MSGLPSRRQALARAAFLGLAHLLVDAASLTVLYDEVALDRLPVEVLYGWVALYNVLAFGLQLPLGLVADPCGAYRAAVLAGLGGVVAAVLVGTRLTPAAVVLAGVGNALFHVGAGGLVLRGAEGRAADGGVFVAPGALGVALGLWLGGRGTLAHGLLLAGLACCAVVVGLGRGSEGGRGGLPAGGTRIGPGWAAAAVALLFVATMARSVVGGALAAGDAEPGAGVLAYLPLAAVAGKALGGFAGDWAGWRRTAVAALVVLAVVLGTAGDGAGERWAGLLLVQLPMAVTLAGLALALPGRPATAFGATSLALVVGWGLGGAGLLPGPASAGGLAAVALGSAAVVWVGLTLARHWAAGRPGRSRRLISAKR